MAKRQFHSQADVNAIMARTFPELYKPTTDADLEVARRPIDGMLFSIGQTVRRAVTGQEGTVESCTVYPDGRFKYVVAWHNGDRQWVWETDLRVAERSLSQPEGGR